MCIRLNQTREKFILAQGVIWGFLDKLERRGNGANLGKWRDGATGQIWKAGENGKGNEREKRGKGKRGFEGGPREGEEGSKGRVREDLRKHQRKLNVVKV